MSRVVIAGGQGFIGTALQKTLHNKKIPFILLSPMRNLSIEERDRVLHKQIKKNDILINLIGRFASTFSLQIEANVILTQQLCEVAVKKHVQKFIHISAAAVFGKKKNPTEIDTRKPNTPYGLSKKMGEDVVFYYHRQHDLPFILLRPTNIYGRGSTHGVIYQFTKAFPTGKVTLHGNGKQQRDFLYVGDFVDAIIRCIQGSKINKSYNLGLGKTYTLMQTVRILEKLQKKKIDIQKKVEETDSSRIISVNTSLFCKDFSWQPSISLEKGLQACI